MRADAKANRDAILRAAAECFRSDGLDTTFEAIAQAAGVGRATMYRHFPTQDVLLGALYERVVEEIEALAAEVPEGAEPLDHVLRAAVRTHTEHLPLVDTLRRQGGLPDEVVLPLRARLRAVYAGPLAQAQAAGAVRDDLDPDDIRLLVTMLVTAVRPHIRPADRKRAMALADAALGRPRR